MIYCLVLQFASSDERIMMYSLFFLEDCGRGGRLGFFVKDLVAPLPDARMGFGSRRQLMVPYWRRIWRCYIPCSAGTL
jgi:hypothetical protein